MLFCILSTQSASQNFVVPVVLGKCFKIPGKKTCGPTFARYADTYSMCKAVLGCTPQPCNPDSV